MCIREAHDDPSAWWYMWLVLIISSTFVQNLDLAFAFCVVHTVEFNNTITMRYHRWRMSVFRSARTTCLGIDSVACMVMTQKIRTRNWRNWKRNAPCVQRYKNIGCLWSKERRLLNHIQCSDLVVRWGDPRQGNYQTVGTEPLEGLFDEFLRSHIRLTVFFFWLVFRLIYGREKHSSTTEK
jgi:hypothetical protein